MLRQPANVAHAAHPAYLAPAPVPVQENIEVMERTEGEDDDSFLVLQSEVRASATYVRSLHACSDRSGLLRSSPVCDPHAP